MTATGRVRVLVWHRPGERADELAAQYHRISRAMAGTPGLLGNELWECGDQRVVMSEWADADAFDRWARDAAQHRVTASLREYRAPDDPPALLCRVVDREGAGRNVREGAGESDREGAREGAPESGREAADAVRGDHV
ncbi:antibiotic biosynthesis monooxygenase family protein [Actinomadura sp. WAC 06369]|uniref:antibiotic biosynthesis monooxygenase family protein n=1 Tax=Actinomadura sp. WAC 06369 TaxID=2203193 RepID=UPI0018F5FBCB|nr:antibiotic biosynthesis monooxygenase [Actinomadura sp. WAC 06369]